MFTNFRLDRRRWFAIAAGVFLFMATILATTAIYNSRFRVIYSLDSRANNKEIIQVIDDADKYVYFAIYYFTKKDIAESLIRAKKRGLTVSGIMDRQASEGSNKDVMAMLKSAGVDIGTQKHEDGIMHVKAIVTDKAYVSGSYNWTAAATEANDEIIEIGTNNSVRKKYLEIIRRIISANRGALASVGSGEEREYDYAEAPAHIGERATVTGKVVKVFTSKSGTTFLDFCSSYKKCPFTAVIFADDLKKFPDVKQYEREVEISGVIRSYQGKAEIILEDSVFIK